MALQRLTTVAAGGIVWRKVGGKASAPEVLTIHRPRYDDWTFPKGKSDPGEGLQTTAVREIVEETGLRVRLGHPLKQQTYPVTTGDKVVSYWCARSYGEATDFRPDNEVDEVRWTGLRDARDLLTYERDVQLLDDFADLVDAKAHRTRTLVVLRHGKAVPREDGDNDDLARPLTHSGADRASVLRPVLSAYGVLRVVSSPAIRCAQTVEPYAHSINTFLEIDDRIAEETSAGQVARSVAALLDRKKPVVLCTHRPTLPWVFDALGIEAHELAPGEAIVVHHRKGSVLAFERLTLD